VIRIAAVGDVHVGTDSAGTLRPHLEHLSERADVLLLAGDLTRVGRPEEARVLAGELADVTIPTIAVLGNHDFESGRASEVREELERANVRVLEGESEVVAVNGSTIGVAGVKGFGGGFVGACGSDFGEPEMKAFIGHTKAVAEALESALSDVTADLVVALMHYAPVEETLQGERLEIYPFLGSYLLAEAADRTGADLVLHGHAHHGQERGVTAGGIRVRNVAQPVIQQAYRVYCFADQDDEVSCGDPT
jgi:Icc-related predicted phosphoesterase